MSYTGEIRLDVVDLERLKEQYDNAGDYADRSFMNELFHGLDHIIEVFKKEEGYDN